jgi:hypothetical protein
VNLVFSNVNSAEAEEGTLRGDKGVREEQDVDQTSYLMRAVSLARNESLLLACAFFCLMVSSVSSLILPNYQVFFNLTSLLLFAFMLPEVHVR